MPDWVMLVAVVSWTVSGLCGWVIACRMERERDDALAEAGRLRYELITSDEIIAERDRHIARLRRNEPGGET